MKQLKNSTGFTLIELLIVMVIIGILVGILLPNLAGMRGRARDTRVKSELAQLKTALQIYYSDFQGFPTAEATPARMLGCGAGGVVACEWGETFSATIDGTSRVYMEQLPEVLVSGGSITYYRPVDDQSYLIAVTLENASDSDIEASVERCNVNTPVENTYYVCP